jgi:excisionase family DNA binding protein
MPAILRGHVHFDSRSADDALLQPGELTTAEAAELAGCTSERIRQLVKSHRIGHWSSRLGMYVIDRDRLRAHIARRKSKTAAST